MVNNKEKSYIDIDPYGREYENGEPYLYYDKDAIKNALMQWLSSKKGEILYYPDEGGVMDTTLFKNASASNINKLRFSLKNAITNYFVPQIIFKGIDVVADTVNKILEISVFYTDPETGEEDTLLIYLNDIKTVEQQQLKEVPYEGENLEMFCMVSKPDMEGKLLIYNEEKGFWIWGERYLFTTLSESSSNFETILSICNS